MKARKDHPYDPGHSLSGFEDTCSPTLELDAKGVGAFLESLFRQCLDSGASDLHLSAHNPPFFRSEGLLRASEGAALSPKSLADIADVLLGDRDRKPFEDHGSIDGSMTSKGKGRFRYNVYRSRGHISIALRLLDEDFRGLENLGLPMSLYDLCELPDGLVIVAGPTGAGKSTTLATLVHRINESRYGHIVTIEDPIEYIHKPVKCLVNQREIGKDACNFGEALIAAMRQDPDVILVGEVRDIHTIRTAITAAETGHLVLTTVHANDCVGAIERLVSVFPANEQVGMRGLLALVLRAIVVQHLLVADGAGQESQEEEEISKRARVAVSEVLRITPAVSHLIANAKSSQIYSAMETGQNAGMQTIDQDLARLWVEGVISKRTALNMAHNPKNLDDRAKLLKNPRRARGLQRKGP